MNLTCIDLGDFPLLLPLPPLFPSLLHFRSQEIRKERHEQRSAATKADLPLDTPEAPPDVEPQDTDPFKVDEYRELQKGSFDTGDPLTTNLYVGNINPKVLRGATNVFIYSYTVKYSTL